MGYHFYLNFAYLSSLSALFPFTLIFLKERYSNKTYQSLFLLVPSTVILELISVTLHFLHMNNLMIGRCYAILQTLLLGIFFFSYLKKQLFKLLIAITLGIFTIIAIVDLAIHGIWSMADLTMTSGCVAVLFFSFMSIYQLISNPVSDSIFSVPVFWINTACLLYFAGNLFLFILNTYILQKSMQLHYEVWVIHSVLNITYNVLIGAGFIKIKYETKKIQAGPGRRPGAL